MTVYILHITERTGQIWHYVGYTKHKTADTRLKAHRDKSRNLQTNEAARRGATIEIGHQFIHWHQQAEKAAICSPMTPSFCEICSAQNMARQLAPKREQEKATS